MIKINFDFNYRRPEDLEQLNAMLATMKLQDLRLENIRDYLATTTDGDGNLIGYRFGVDSGELICKLAKGKSGYYYQIDSVVVDESVDHDEYLEIWRESHPDRVVRIVIRSGYDEVAGYLIVHHQRT
ncbi:MAG: hypothetical protein IJX67_02985 [Oscillospiraceae bacterium]|nr:hypothetical protein [Oscillospiraceae bacterium]